MPRITPNLWFDSQGLEAAQFYVSVFPNSKITAVKTLGQACTGTECRTGQYGCFNGTCTEPCCSNADCGAGYVCSVNGPKIASGYQTGGVPLWSVVPVCLATTASSVRVSGAACTTSADCKSGICEKTSGICVDVTDQGAAAVREHPGLTHAQVRAARAYLGWTALELAEKAGVSFSTVRRVEMQGRRAVRDANIDAIREAFTRSGVRFVVHDDGALGIAGP